MLSKGKVVKGIFDFISIEIEKFGFKLDRKSQFVLRKTPEALLIYDLHFYDRTNIKTGAKGFLIEPYVWINVKGIEAIYKQVTINKELKMESDYLTLGNSVADLKANPDGINRNRNRSLDLFVFEDKNVNYVSWEILKHFKEFANPYFNENATIKAADVLLNKNPREYCVHMPNDTYRFIKGLIAAKLNASSNFEELMFVYSNLIVERDMPDNCKEELSNLKILWQEQ